MGYNLSPGISFCRTGGFTFFLDLGRDRYFALGGVADAAFARLVAHEPAVPGDDTALSELEADRLIARTADADRPSPCGHERRAIASALDLPPTTAIRSSSLRAYARIRIAHWTIKHGGMAKALDQLSQRKARTRQQPALPGQLAAISASFERCNAVSSPLDQCLPRSIAVAHRLLDFGVLPTLMIGVRAEPFAAHCWVECADLIVNDRYDTVRPFAPILVL